MKKILVFFAILLCVLGLSNISVDAKTVKVDNKKLDYERIINDNSNTNLDNDTVYKIFNDMYSRYPEAIYSLNITKNSSLSDMAGNKYNLVEFNPSGYAIYNKDYSFLMEVSANAESPYKNMEGDLIYLGALNYYSKRHDSILISLYDRLINSGKDLEIELNNSNLNTLITHSKKLFSSIKNKINSLNMIVETGGEKYTNPADCKTWSHEDSSYEIASVNHPEIFANADTTGYNQKGNCGFVAGALLIYYAAKGWGLTDLYSGETFQKTFVEEFQGNKPNGSGPADIEDSLNKYLKSHKAKNFAKVNMWYIPAAHSIFDRVNEDKPVAIFGQMPKFDVDGTLCNHAVVVYQVHRNYQTHIFGIRTYSNYEYRVHCGWGSKLNDVVIAHDAILIGGMVNLHH